jgi:hypothetical protein
VWEGDDDALAVLLGVAVEDVDGVKVGLLLLEAE